MAWPPATIAADKGPGAPTSNTEHPDHHNALAAAVNDITTEFTSGALGTKLDGIEAGAQVNTIATETTVGGVEFATRAEAAARASTLLAVTPDGLDAALDAHEVAVNPHPAYMTDIVSDTTPQLGGNLDVNGFTVDGRDPSADGTALDTVVTKLGSGYEGGATTLAARLSTISNFASPNAGGVVVGQFYDNSFQGTASSTLAGAANRIDMAPYYTSVPLSIDQIGVAVSTAVAASNVKIVIYSSGASGWPDARLYESADISTASTGYAFASLSFSFSSGVQYWVGVRHSSTATLRTINLASAVNLGLTSSSAANYATIIRRTLTYATAATTPWVFTNTDRVANVTPPSIRFRAA